MIAETEQPYQKKKKSEWLEESGTFRVRPILKLKMGKIQWFFFGEPLGSSDVRGQILVTRKLAIRDDPPTSG